VTENKGKFKVPPTSLCKFWVDLRTNIVFCPVQHSVIGFVTELQSIYCEVRTGPISIKDYVWSVKG